jgi:hypothetical protein
MQFGWVNAKLKIMQKEVNKWKSSMFSINFRLLHNSSRYFSYIDIWFKSCYALLALFLCTMCNSWWPLESMQAKPGNNNILKKLYYKLWTMLHHRGVWDYPEYLVKRENMIRQIKDDEVTVKVRCEIMPQCVANRVREWYPNLRGRQYMGHRWAWQVRKLEVHSADWG